MAMSPGMSPSTDQGTAGNVQRMPRDALDDRIDELEQRLAALTADSSPSRSSNASFRTAREDVTPKPLSQKARGKRKEQDSPKRPNPVLFPPRGSRSQSFTTTQTSSRPTTHRASTRPSTRRNSTAPTSQVPSASSSRREGREPTSTRPSASSSRRGVTGPDSQGASSSSSRHSSFRISRPAATQLAATQLRRPTHLHRRNNTTWPPPTVIQDGRQALQSIHAFSGLRDDIFSSMQAEERLHSRSLPTLLRPNTGTSPVPTANDPIGNRSQSPHEYSNHVPAANIDWTLPSTRRREYEKIDKARSGFRGLIRRVTPRILRKNGRVGFHNHDDDDDDGKGSDAGTVRRFRMDVTDGDSAVEEIPCSPWWKFGKKKAKRKGNSSTEGGRALD